MSYIFDLHRYQMQYGLRKVYAEDVRATPLTMKPAHSPQRAYPYFTQKIRQEQGPLIAESPRTTRFIPDTPIYVSNEAFNSATWWKDHMRSPSRAWVSETEKPYRDWPYDRLQQGILV